eukprot:TRINITY_DN318_c0_g1_i1.p1 TRINITY_DN318_c0_g1~~TRINITY_DN318_c0_g1_i1.p1  ORF type:complete len:189 (-),score=33.03 TRINITY_DN318_c0_g1_i1:212-778(-)
MKAGLIALLVVVFAALCAAQTRPNLPEIFEADATLNVTMGSRSISAKGYWRSDQPAGKGVEDFTFDEPHGNRTYRVIQRYDLHNIFRISSGPTKCVSHRTQGEMPPVWNFLHSAKFNTTTTFNNVKVDLWEFAGPGFRVTLGVSSSNVNVPVFLRTAHSAETTTVTFNNWQTNAPNANWFSVPSICHK